MSSTIVSDTGPIITLEKLPGGFALLRKLYDKILIPQEVLNERAESFDTPKDYLKHFELLDFFRIEQAQIPSSDTAIASLDLGEQAAIALAEQHGLALLIEERTGRAVAKNRGLHFSGIAGQILKAQRNHLIQRPEAESMLGDLFEANRINRKLHTALMEEARRLTP